MKTMELYIKVYETCKHCNGTGEIDDITRGPEECVNCVNGKVEKLMKISNNVIEWYMGKPLSELLYYLGYKKELQEDKLN